MWHTWADDTTQLKTALYDCVTHSQQRQGKTVENCQKPYVDCSGTSSEIRVSLWAPAAGQSMQVATQFVLQIKWPTLYIRTTPNVWRCFSKQIWKKRLFKIHSQIITLYVWPIRNFANTLSSSRFFSMMMTKFLLLIWCHEVASFCHRLSIAFPKIVSRVAL